MNRILKLTALTLCLCLIAGCSTASSAPSGAAAQPSESVAPSQSAGPDTTYEDMLGDWSLKVSEDEELYLMPELDLYYGATGIRIDEINGHEAKGTIYSISGAPSYRQATVSFEGDIVDGRLTAAYEDEAWLYSGTIELTLAADQITAHITREKSDQTSLWGIPEGTFTYLRPIETEAVTLSDAEQTMFAAFLSVVTRKMIPPFDVGGLTDEMIIECIGLNLAIGSIDPSAFGSRVQSGTEITFDETVMNALASKYFGVEVNEPRSTDTVRYSNGIYTIPALGGIMEYPVLQRLMKDTVNEGIYYALVDYMLDTPDKGLHLAYQSLITLQKANDAYAIESIKNVSDPIDFELLNAISQ